MAYHRVLTPSRTRPVANLLFKSRKAKQLFPWSVVGRGRAGASNKTTEVTA